MRGSEHGSVMWAWTSAVSVDQPSLPQLAPWQNYTETSARYCGANGRY